MPEVLGIDYAWQHPDPAQIKADGYVAVGRYLSNDPTKDITAEELAALAAVGLGIWFVWESTRGRILEGASAGQTDGAKARVKLDALGVPASIPIFCAFDQDDRGSGNWQPAVDAYLAAFNAATGHPDAPYGSVRVVDRYTRPAWQAEAWSGTAISMYAAIYQRVSHTLPEIGGDYDENVIFDSSVIWFPSNPAPPVISIAPPVTNEGVTVASPAPESIKKGSTGQAVSNWQGLLCANGHATAIDGNFGNDTDAKTRAWQGSRGLTVDGWPGPLSWGAMVGTTFS